MSYNRDVVELIPPGAANASVIWLHGLGASGDDFLPILNDFKFDQELKIRFIFPHAPYRAITVNYGAMTRAWYDITSFSEINEDNAKNPSHRWLKESAQLINQYIYHEIAQGIPAHKIILIGFSQGGALALHCGLRFQHRLAGIVCLSGYLPWQHLLPQEKTLINQDVPILLAHGSFDPIIPLTLSRQSYELLHKLNYNVAWRTYAMPHTIIPTEIIDLNSFINKVLLA